MKKGIITDNLTDLIDDKIEKEDVYNLFGQPIPAKVMQYDHIKRTVKLKPVTNIIDDNADYIQEQEI